MFSKPSPDPLDGLGCSFTMGLGDVFVVVPTDAQPGNVADTLRRLAEDIEHDGPIRSLQLPDLRRPR